MRMHAIDCTDVAPVAWTSKIQIRLVPREGWYGSQFKGFAGGVSPSTRGTAAATLLEYYACVAETQYPAAHAGLIQSGALCSGLAHQRNYFSQFNQALWALREYCINLREK